MNTAVNAIQTIMKPPVDMINPAVCWSFSAEKPHSSGTWV
jgi:hypothetical protein